MQVTTIYCNASIRKYDYKGFRHIYNSPLPSKDATKIITTNKHGNILCYDVRRLRIPVFLSYVAYMCCKRKTARPPGRNDIDHMRRVLVALDTCRVESTTRLRNKIEHFRWKNDKTQKRNHTEDEEWTQKASQPTSMRKSISNAPARVLKSCARMPGRPYFVTSASVSPLTCRGVTHGKDQQVNHKFNSNMNSIQH